MERRTATATATMPLNAKKKKSSGKLIFTLVLVLLVVGALTAGVLCYLNDYFEVRTRIVGFFITQDGQYRMRMALLDQRERELVQTQAQLSQMAEAQENTQKAQQKEQARLEALQTELKKGNDGLNARITAFDRAVAEFDSLVETIEAMDAKNAAAVLQDLSSVADAAKILNALPAKKAAAVLEQMSTEGAIAITEELLELSQ